MRDLKAYLLIAFTLLAFYLVAQYNQPKPVSWKPTFDKKDKIPFGTYVVFNQLKDIFPQSNVRSLREAPFVAVTEEIKGSGNYIIVAPRIKLDKFDFDELLKYMHGGNNVFIASFNLSTYLIDSLKLKVNSERKSSSGRISVGFVNPRLNPDKRYTFDRGIGEQYFSSVDSGKAIVLGINSKGHPNFVKYQYGKGALYLMASPFFFSNYNMLKPGGAEYIAKALSYLPVRSEVIWDEFSALGAIDSGDSPLRFFLTNEPLRWAYFIALFSLIAFILYEIKRRQRIIPIIESLKNSSADFVRVVGQVYYQKRDNANIAQKKIAYFLEGVRSKYGIKTNVMDRAFHDSLISKSGVNSDLILRLINQIVDLPPSRVTDQQLIALNNTIEEFHRQSKQ